MHGSPNVKIIAGNDITMHKNYEIDIQHGISLHFFIFRPNLGLSGGRQQVVNGLPDQFWK